MSTPRGPGLDDYLRLFEPYSQQLSQFTGRKGEYGGRFALLFHQVVRLVAHPDPINRHMPSVFTKVASRFLDRDPDTVKHFSYEDNRHFYLSDLYDWLQIQERGRQMQRMGRPKP